MFLAQLSDSNKTLLGFRALLLVLDCIAICILGNYLHLVYGYTGVDDWEAIEVILVISFAAFSALWSCVCITCLCKSEDLRPGYEVGFDLFAFCAIFPFAVLLTINATYYEEYGSCSTDTSHQQIGCGRKPLIDAACAMLLCASVVEFGLFVRACVATDRRRIGNTRRLIQEGVATELSRHNTAGEVELRAIIAERVAEELTRRDKDERPPTYVASNNETADR